MAETSQREWRYEDGNTVSDDGWRLCRSPGGGWSLEHSDGRSQQFATDGGLYLAIDMADAYLDGRTTLDRE